MAGNVPLLRLPLELQHEIYSYVIASQSSEFINERGYLSFPVALLHVCRLLRSAFVAYICQYHTFVVYLERDSVSPCVHHFTIHQKALGTNRPDFWRSNCIESEDCNTYRQWVRKCAVILDFSASTGDDHQADLIQKRRQVEKLVDLLKEFESLDTLTISLDSYIRHSWVSLGKREYNEGVDSPHRRRMNEREYQKLLRTTTIILEPLKQLRGIRNVQMNHNTDLLQDGELQDIVREIMSPTSPSEPKSLSTEQLIKHSRALRPRKLPPFPRRCPFCGRRHV